MKLLVSDIIGIIAVIQACLLVIFFLTNKRGDAVTNKIFAVLLFLFTLNICYSLSNSDTFIPYLKKYRLIIFLISQVAFLIGPLLYLYIKSIIIRDFAITRRDLKHALPFITSLLFMTVISLLPKSIFPNHLPILYFYFGGLLIQEFIYLLLIIKLLKRYDITFKKLFSPKRDTKFSWLRLLLVGYIFIWNVKLQIFVFTDVHLYPDFCPYRESLYFLVMFLFINTIIFVALKKSDLFSGFNKYKGNSLDPSEKENYREKLTQALETQKIYLDPNLTMPALSRQLSIPVRCLSQLINESFDKNFNDFINEYRVQESIRKMHDHSDKKHTMLEIAYSVGFNSKSSFYEAFKKYTGMTPGKFQNGRAL
jgi:AraC-like DNA-binding protein